MYKKGFDRSTWIIILIGAITVFMIITSGILYTALKTGTILGYNLTSPENTSEVHPLINDTTPIPRPITCSFTQAYWSQDEVSILWAHSNDTVDGIVESINCERERASIDIFKRINGTDTLVDHKDVTLSESIVFSFKLDSASNDTTYFFIVSVTNNASISINSPLLGINSAPESLFFDPTFCNGFTDDTSYLYNVSTFVFNRGDGKKSFILSFNGTVIRSNTSGDQFYTDHSNGALNVQYDIIPTCGGVDVVYAITNPTLQQQLLPDFGIDGIKQPKIDAKYLHTREWGTLTDATPGDGIYYQIPYPYDAVYSPVMVAVNTNLSIGASFEYPYMQYKQGIQPLLFWNADGTSRYVYNLHYTIQNIPPQVAVIGPGETKSYTIAFRFSSSRNWLLTLAPYKKYFNSLYDSGRSSRPKDLRPVAGISVADSLWQDDVTNPRGYVPDDLDPPGIYRRSRLDLHGWKNTTDWFLATFPGNGYKRSMIWSPSGIYKDSACYYCNFPPQFMDWLPMLVSTQSELLRFAQNGISLGFWWGHAGRIPVPNTWPPQSIKIANYSDPADRAFLEQQLDLAYQRGAKEIGLDALTEMEPYDRYIWADNMKQRAPGVNFLHETGGPDFVHTKISNFYTDTYIIQSNSWYYIGGPHLLSLYLNPNSEIWVFPLLSGEQFYAAGAAQGMTARARQLTQWGDTFVEAWNAVNVTNWDMHLSQCLDGLDNDNDGKVDWPRDLGCASEFDLTED